MIRLIGALGKNPWHMILYVYFSVAQAIHIPHAAYVPAPAPALASPSLCTKRPCLDIQQSSVHSPHWFAHCEPVWIARTACMDKPKLEGLAGHWPIVPLLDVQRPTKPGSQFFSFSTLPSAQSNPCSHTSAPSSQTAPPPLNRYRLRHTSLLSTTLYA